MKANYLVIFVFVIIISIIVAIRMVYTDITEILLATEAKKVWAGYNATEGMRPFVVTVSGNVSLSISDFLAPHKYGLGKECSETTDCYFEIDCDGDGVFEVQSSNFGQTQSGEHYSVNISDSEANVVCKYTGDFYHYVAVRGNISGFRVGIQAKPKLWGSYISLDQWGDIEWSCINIFSDCDNFFNCEPSNKVQRVIYNAFDNPNLKNVKSLSYWSRAYKCFAGSIENWDVSHVKYMDNAFSSSTNLGDSEFNHPFERKASDAQMLTLLSQQMAYQPIKHTPQMAHEGRNMCYAFNQPLDKWDVSNVVNMSSMFWGAKSFNQPLDNWDVSNVTNMRSMFDGASSFNQRLDKWDVSHVTDMSNMFAYARSFNQPLNNWNVSSVTNMHSMFGDARSFNQPLDGWEVSHVKDMSEMFKGARSFNQSLDDWDVFVLTKTTEMFDSTNSLENLPSWYR